MDFNGLMKECKDSHNVYFGCCYTIGSYSELCNGYWFGFFLGMEGFRLLGETGAKQGPVPNAGSWILMKLMPRLMV